MGCRRLGGAVRIEVWDTGPGIPPEKQLEIFEEFRRLDDDQQSNTDRGLGLGLAIADRLSRLMDHPLALRSWPGHGSVFSITVPFGDPAQVARSEPKVQRAVNDRVMGLRVLCLDNEPAVLEGMRALLSGWGADVAAFRDAASVAEDFRQTNRVPDLALIDYHLDDGRNGVDVLRQLQNLWGRKVPAIVISADHTLQAVSASDAQRFLFLPKPVKPAALRALMTRAMQQQGESE
jgi:CheY-like chemotaxis protein